MSLIYINVTSDHKNRGYEVMIMRSKYKPPQTSSHSSQLSWWLVLGAELERASCSIFNIFCCNATSGASLAASPGSFSVKRKIETVQKYTNKNFSFLENIMYPRRRDTDCTLRVDISSAKKNKTLKFFGQTF